MVTQDTQNFILQVVDYNQEYTTKLILFIGLFIMFLYFYYYSKQVLPDFNALFSTELSKTITALIMRILSIIFIPLAPLWFIVFMYRQIALEEIMRYLFYGYSIGFILLGIVGMIFGFEVLLRLLGMQGLSVRKIRKLVSKKRRTKK